MPQHDTARGLMEELSRRIGAEVALLHRGRPVDPDEPMLGEWCVPLEATLRLKGGKGGFGSMLRAMGSQRSGFETDNIESCRDLTGRRLRHVNDEKKIAEWAAEEEERKASAAKAKREKRAAILNTVVRVNFDDQGLAVDIHEQSQKVDEGVRAGFTAALEHAERLSAAAVAPPVAKRARVAAADDWDCSSTSGEEEEGEDAASGKTAACGAEVASPKVGDTAAAVEEDAPASVPAESASEPAPVAKVPVVPKPCAPVTPEHLDLSDYDSVEKLEALGLDRLKAALMAAGLKCGGTLRDRAIRLFSVRGLKPDAFPANLRAQYKA